MNVESRTYYEKIDEISVPLHDGKCTARDVSDLLFVTQQMLAAAERPATSDDAFYVEADGESLKVQIREEWKP